MKTPKGNKCQHNLASSFQTLTIYKTTFFIFYFKILSIKFDSLPFCVAVISAPKPVAAICKLTNSY